jgi:hypothetical protein
MGKSIAACLNVYNDAAPLRGALEACQAYFDNIYVIHSGPGGAVSTDGTMEVLAEFGIKPVMADIQEGFGVIRTRLIHGCGCDWAFIMDADERFFPALPILRCHGTDRYPHVQEPALAVTRAQELIYPGKYLREMIEQPNIDAIKTIRRHWFGFDMQRPAENWERIKDWQMRIVRNVEHIGYASKVRMHERLTDLRSNNEPRHLTGDDIGGPFHDHFHLHFRRARPGHKEGNEQNYERLSRGETMLAS